MSNRDAMRRLNIADR